MSNVPPIDPTICPDCGNEAVLSAQGRCSDCQTTFEAAEEAFDHMVEMDLDDMVDAIEKASTVDEVMDVFTRVTPPGDKLEQQRTRERLLKALSGRVSSPAKLVDAWLGSAPMRDDQIVAAQAGILVNLALDNAQLFHDPTGEPYATIKAGHWETHHVRKRAFQLWLRKLWYDRYKLRTGQEPAPEEEDGLLGLLAKIAGSPESPAPQAQAVRDAIAQLESLAVFEGDEHEVHVRVASVGSLIYIDLGDEDWKAIEISKGGWQVVENHGIRFVRAPGMLPLTEPKTGGTISDLRRFVNVSDEDWPLLAGFVAGLFMPSGPYPVLNLLGEQGSAKTSSARFIRRLVDPYSPLDRGRPRNEHELAISAEWAWCLSYDNLGTIADWLSDAFCRISTGGGFGARMLYTDDEERRFDACRPIIINGITDLATRGDLLDRSVVLTLPRIEVRDHAEIEADFERALPSLLGSTLDAVVVALNRRDEVSLPVVPRMADFARWATAAEPGLGIEEGSFLNAYLANREASHQVAIESDPVALAIEMLMKSTAEWTGTATELLEALTNTVSEMMAKSKAWPKAANALSRRLRRLAPDLRSLDIDIAFPSAHLHARTLTITRLRKDRPNRPNRPSDSETPGSEDGIEDGRGRSEDDKDDEKPLF